MRKNTETTPAEETVSAIDDRRRLYAERLRAEIPADWDIHNIGDLCNIRTGKLDVNQADEGGKYPFFTCAEKIYRINTHAFDAEAVLVAGNGFFNVKYYKGKFNAYQRTYVLSDIKTDAKFLFYYVDYRLRDITGESRGSTISYIRLGDLRDYPVAVAPPDQQKGIVSEIEKQFSRLDEAVTNLKRVKANLKRYNASVLKAAVEGKLTEDWRKQHPNVEPASKLLERILVIRRAKWIGMGNYVEPADLDIKNLTKLPEGWIWCNLDCVSFGYQNGLSKRKADSGIPTRVLRLADVVNGKISGASPREIPLSKEELDKYLLKEGELVCIRVNGSRDLVGRLVCFDVPGKWAYCDHFIRIHLAGRLVSPEYVAHVFATKGTRDHFERSMVSTAGQHTVNQQALKATAIPFPPRAEQDQIVAEVERHLSVIEKLEAAVQVNLTRADRLRQSILHDVFTGRRSMRILQFEQVK